ncbi:hypothetical protein BST61_g7168 [Cercospora zeina]
MALSLSLVYSAFHEFIRHKLFHPLIFDNNTEQGKALCHLEWRLTDLIGTYLQPGTWRGQRPDGHPVRDDSLRAMPDRPRTAPSPVPQPSPAGWSVPVDQVPAEQRDAGKRRLEGAAKRFVGAASKGIKRIPQAFRRQEPLKSLEPDDTVGPAITGPEVDEWDNLTGHEILPRLNARGIEEARARLNYEDPEVLRRRAARAAAEPPFEVLYQAAQAAAAQHAVPKRPTAARREQTRQVVLAAGGVWADDWEFFVQPATAEELVEDELRRARHVPEQTSEPPHPKAEKKLRRRVVESTWGAFQVAAIRRDTPPEETATAEETVPETTMPSQYPRNNDAYEISRTTRQPIPQADVDQSLPATPSPDSARRRTLVRPRSADASPPSHGPFVRTDAWYRPGAGPARPLAPIAEPDEKARRDREKALRALEGRTDEVPAAGHTTRTGQITAHLRQLRENRPVDSPQVQHDRAPRRPDVLTHRPSDENDDATNIWRRLEKDAGYRMRD